MGGGWRGEAGIGGSPARGGALILHPSLSPYPLPPPPSVDKVTAALGAVDKRAADDRKSLPPKPIAEGLLVYIKKQAWER